MLSIVQAQMPEYASEVRGLFSQYLQWGNLMLRQEYGISLDVGAMLEDDMTTAGKFVPPCGCLLLALVDGEVVGSACMRQIAPDIAEIKRMYVRPEHRGQGIGRTLLAAVLERAENAGYSCIRLDSVHFMREAHALYRSAGFREIGPYVGTEIPAEYREHWVFMEKTLPALSSSNGTARQ